MPETQATYNITSVDATLAFFKEAVPVPDSKNLHSQVGCHIEEFHEMLEQLTINHPLHDLVLYAAKQATKALSDILKQNDNILNIKDSVLFLDSLCDQQVTAIGVGYMYGYDIKSAFGEVNKSNLSKFDENGKAVFDINKKIIKSNLYRKPDLTPFV